MPRVKPSPHPSGKDQAFFDGPAFFGAAFFAAPAVFVEAVFVEAVFVEAVLGAAVLGAAFFVAVGLPPFFAGAAACLARIRSSACSTVTSSLAIVLGIVAFTSLHLT